MLGRLEINKKLKQERNEKRIEHFKLRREEGKAYEYKPNPFDRNSEDRKERRKYWKEHNRRAVKNVDHKLPLQKFTSLMRRTQNEIDKREAEIKALMQNKKNKKKSEVVADE